MHNLNLSTWGNVSEGCPVRCTVSGSDVACLIIGGGPTAFELSLDAHSLRLLAQQTTAAIAEMDVLFEQEEAARELVG